MSIKSISQLKNWFRRGNYPTEQQFSDWLDSYVHKYDSLPIVQVEGLAGQLNNKFPLTGGTELERRQTILETDFNNHKRDSKQQFNNIARDILELENQDDDVEFDGFASVDAEEIEVSPAWDANLTKAYVVYNRTNNRFLLANQVSTTETHYYSRWPGSDSFGISHWKQGVTPYPHKTYSCLIEVIDNEDSSHFERAYYRWNGCWLTVNSANNPAIMVYAYGVTSTESKYNVVKRQYLMPSAAEPDCDVVYAADLNRFMLRTPGATADVTNLYPTFVEQAEFGIPDPTGAGIIPYGFKIYRNSISGEFQQWNGQKLTTPLSTYDVQAALSEVASTYATAINSLRATVDTLTEKVNALETRFAGGVLLL